MRSNYEAKTRPERGVYECLKCHHKIVQSNEAFLLSKCPKCESTTFRKVFKAF